MKTKSHIAIQQIRASFQIQIIDQQDQTLEPFVGLIYITWLKIRRIASTYMYEYSLIMWCLPEESLKVVAEAIPVMELVCQIHATSVGDFRVSFSVCNMSKIKHKSQR